MIKRIAISMIFMGFLNATASMEKVKAESVAHSSQAKDFFLSHVKELRLTGIGLTKSAQSIYKSIDYKNPSDVKTKSSWLGNICRLVAQYAGYAERIAKSYDEHYLCFSLRDNQTTIENYLRDIVKKSLSKK